MRVLLAGYFGAGNLGDELLLKSILHFWEKKKLRPAVVVISHNPEETKKTFSVEAIPWNNFFKILPTISRSDVFLLTGGIFQDQTSWKSLYYYLFLIVLAKLFCLRVIIYAAGVENLHPFNRWILRLVFASCSVINVRDDLSRRFLLDCKIPAEKIGLGVDSAFLLAELITPKKELPAKSPMVGFILRPSHRQQIPAEVFSRLITLVNKTLQAKIVLIPFHQNQDRQFLETVAATAAEAKVQIWEWEKPDDIFSHFSQLDLVVSQRLHGIILATMYQIPVLGIGDNPKIQQFLKEIRQKNIITYPVEAQLLLALIKDLWEWRLEFRQFYQKTIADFRHRLRVNQKILSDIIS